MSIPTKRKKKSKPTEEERPLPAALLCFICVQARQSAGGAFPARKTSRAKRPTLKA
jgi:hypothetical protein